jgi:Ni,Fe-hydrogenase III large subunit
MSAAAIIRAAPSVTCRPWSRHVLPAADWQAMADALATEPLDLLAMWADTSQVHALFLDPAGQPLPASTPVTDGQYPALSPRRPAAAWFERMVHDLWGHAAIGGTDMRPWLDHGQWGLTRPLAVRSNGSETATEPVFLPAEGDGLHQIPVGPIHAGIIEPGHFRFHAAGETVVRLEARLGYAHKGTLLMMRSKSPRAAARFAARLSGDATVAHAVAFARAAEAALEIEAPPRAHALRGVMAELERIANHLGDVGAICNDASFAFAQARFGLHREAMLRAAAQAFGHRLMMDVVIPGGVASDIAPGGGATILAALDALDAELPGLTRIYDETSSLADRVLGCGVVSPAAASAYAAGGFVGRASSRAFDARRAPGYPPYAQYPFTVPVLAAGDVDARVRVRLAEIQESTSLLRRLLEPLPPGTINAALPTTSGEGIGVAESFRGDVWHWLRLDGGLIASAFAADPSWRQWPLVELAALDSIVADFPLINKSFNCAYSGIDL